MRRRALGGVAIGALTAVGALLFTAVQGASQPPKQCTAAERRAVLKQEQAAVLHRLGRLTVLRNTADLRAVMALNYVFLAHEFTSFANIGLTIIDPIDTPRPGVPNLVFYGPNPKAKDTTHPRGPDFPYTLVGWGYGVPYVPGHIPAIIPCMGDRDWLIHERGVHPVSTGGMIPMPPTESYYGESPGGFTDPPAMQPVIGWPHGRSWTVHFWLQKGRVPLSAIATPRPVSGIDPGLGSSFYFPESPPASSHNAAPETRLWPLLGKRLS